MCTSVCTLSIVACASPKPSATRFFLVQVLFLTVYALKQDVHPFVQSLVRLRTGLPHFFKLPAISSTIQNDPGTKGSEKTPATGLIQQGLQ